MTRWLLIAAGVFLLWSTQAQAWGNSGHRTVCEIALLNLTPATRAEVDRLMAENREALGTPFGQFQHACTYPDAVDGDGRSIEHYVNWPRTLAAVTAHGCGTRPRCVLSAINLDLSRLRSRSLSARRRALALSYLGHWVGDVHQPLHSSYGDDIGGGHILTSGLCRYGLHSTWDTCMFEREFLPGSRRDEDIHALAEEWNGSISDSDRREWRRAARWQWAGESYEQARQPWMGYCSMRQGACWYSPTERVLASDSERRTFDIDEAYVRAARPVIRRRILQGGVRLAHLLNRALDPGYRG